MEFKNVSKKAIWNMLLAALVWVAAVAVAAMWLWFLIEVDVPTALAVVYWCFFGLCCAALVVSPFVRYRRYRYLIDDKRVAKREGLIFVTVELVPIERIHQISVMRGPIDRLTGLGKVMVTTAGGTIVIRFLELATANELVEKLEGNIRQIVKVQGEMQ